MENNPCPKYKMLYTIRIPLLLLSSVFISYALEPVPPALMNLFQTSNLFKFVVLVTVGLTAFEAEALTGRHIINICVSSVVLLLVFDRWRGVGVTPPLPPHQGETSP